MQFDAFDKKAKEAADHHHPAYDEQAWKKMEKLLDKHLPQKKDRRRRIIFFLLFFLLIGGASYFLANKFSGNNKNEVAGINNVPVQSTPATSESKSSPEKINPSQPAIEKLNKNNQTNQQTQGENKMHTETNQTILAANQNKISQTFNKPQKRSEQKESVNKNIMNNEKNISPTIVNSLPLNNDKDTKLFQSQKDDKDQSIVSKDVTISKTSLDAVNKKTDTSESNNKTETVKKDETTATVNASKKIEEKNKRSGRQTKGEKFFALTVSAGPDVSKAGSSSLSRLTFSYGAGVSYTLNRFTLRSGFFVAKKVYNAGANDYTLDYTLPPNIKLLSVKADCKVYEVPLSVAYNFGKSKNANWFAGIGLSSYFMKSEKYDNSYKNTSTNSTYSRNFQYTNQNKHYFSVLDLSAGYTRKLNKKVSLSVEPYLKIPMQGVGEGKVHLNSAGILFSANIKPFQKKNK